MDGFPFFGAAAQGVAPSGHWLKKEHCFPFLNAKSVKMKPKPFTCIEDIPSPGPSGEGNSVKVSPREKPLLVGPEVHAHTAIPVMNKGTKHFRYPTDAMRLKSRGNQKVKNIKFSINEIDRGKKVDDTKLHDEIQKRNLEKCNKVYLNSDFGSPWDNLLGESDA